MPEERKLPFCSQMITSVTKRNLGQTRRMCQEIAHSIKRGESVFIATIGEQVEDMERYRKIIFEDSKVEIVYEPSTVLEPFSPFRTIYDRWGEPIGIESVPQTERTNGYYITLKSQNT